MKESLQSYTLFGIDFSQNPEQKELIRLIRAEPERVPLIFVYGEAGTGKTFAALAGALDQVRGHGANKKRYKTIYYVREPVEIGHHLGYLKGTEEDKFAPYLGGLLDNYQSLMDNAKAAGERTLPLRNFDSLTPEEYLRLPSDIVPLAPEFLRGRSFQDSIILVDEAQNLTLDEIHTIVTRIGRNTKLIFLGSPNQVDVDFKGEENPFVVAPRILEPTGLSYVVTLKKSMRTGFTAECDRLFLEYKLSLKKKK
ncbi:MAG: PhoH family protein [Bacilli bacterium]|nr:PhoH family protein [Bacilli bacterium]